MNTFKKTITPLFSLVPLLVVYLIFLIVRPTVFSEPSTILMGIIQAISVCLVAWGISFNMSAGVMDLSVGAEIAVVGVSGVVLANAAGNYAMLFIGGFATSTVIFLVKVLVYNLVKLNSFVVSIALTYALAAVSGIIGKGKNLAIATVPFFSNDLLYVTVFVLTGLIVYVLNRYSTFGLHVQALSGSVELTESTGVKAWRTRIGTIFVSSAFCYLVAMLNVCRGGGTAMTTDIESISSVFQAMMAFFIAGSLSKYINQTVGVYIGAMCFSFLNIGLIAINLDSNFKNTVIGVGLVTLIAVSMINANRQADKIRRELSAARRAQSAIQQ